MDNKELIALVKGILDTNTGGLVSTQQLSKFITTVIDKSAFLKAVRVETNIAVKLELDRLGLERRILRAKIEATPPDSDEYTAATRSFETLQPTKVMLPAKLTYEWLQKAIGGTPDLNPDTQSQLMSLIYDLIAKQFGNDLVDLVINGDTAKTTDPFLKINDGLLKKLTVNTNAHKSEFAETDGWMDIFGAMLNDMPDDFKINLGDLRFYVSPKNEQMYRSSISKRGTPLGDIMLMKSEPVFYSGVKVEPLWAMPQTAALLTIPENIAIGFGSRMLMERFKDIEAQVIKVMTTCDIDTNIVVPDAAVLYTQKA